MGQIDAAACRDRAHACVPTKAYVEEKGHLNTPSHTHSHGTNDVSDGVLLWTIIINLGLSVFEFTAGAIARSVALMADALHNTNDAAALLIAYIARKISHKGADEKFTYGYRRAELIGAMTWINSV